tara:strand:- start:502 stop:1185 length:684 start_codon:yes stop_codon:yes gene_type:complete
MDRISRFINNKKQDKITLVKIQPSINSMREGEEVLYNHPNGMLMRYRKQNGRLWSSSMTNNGNMIVDKKLTTNRLEYENSFVHYTTYIHNFEEDIGTSKYYLPWTGSAERDDMDFATSGFVSPFKMTLKKIIIRCDNLDASDDVRIRLETQDDDATEDIVATATYDVSEVGAVSSYNNFELHTSDFDNSPTVSSGKKTGLSIQASSNITTATAYFWITSIWKTFIEI